MELQLGHYITLVLLLEAGWKQFVFVRHLIHRSARNDSNSSSNKVDELKVQAE